jgi:hypothetical protein
MKTKDLEIKDYLYYPDVDVFLIRAWRPGLGNRLPRAVVGWMPRMKPETLLCTRSFPDIRASVKAYKTITESGEFPDKLLNAADLFKKKVYEWEDKTLLPYFDSPIPDIATARTILQRISRELAIRCPKLVWLDEEQNSYYDDDTNTIEFGHRSLLPLLHEVAHGLQNLKSCNDGNEMHHSPGFVWHAIHLYNRFAGIELDYLVQSAAIAGILGPLKVEGPQHYIQAALSITPLMKPTPS